MVTTKERIQEIEKFLGEEEKRVVEPVPFVGRYKSDTGLFSGDFKGDIDLPEQQVAPTPLPTPTPTPPPPSVPIIPPAPETYDDETLRLLSIIATNQGMVVEGQNKVIEGQEMDRSEYERNNPLITDNPCYDFAEATINPGFQVIFTLAIPEGQVFFFDYFNITYNVDSTYELTIDNVGDPTLPILTDVLQDFGDHSPMFKPPRLCYASIVISALNNGIIAETYSVFIRGWFRQTIKLDKDYVGQR